MRFLLSTALLTCLPAIALAADDGHTELGAHEHGSGVFNVAIEGNTLAMELEAPGADIVGFEHAAKSAKDKAAVKKAKATLADLHHVVDLPAAAGCKLTKANIELHSEGGDHGKHDDHDHDKKAEKHDDHDHDHGKKAEKHDDHDHGEAKEAGHTEFHAEYQLNCAKPGQLTAFVFTYFKNFKGAEELDVSITGPSGQKKFEVKRGNIKVDLAGIM